LARGFTKIYLKSDLTLTGIPDGVLDGLTIIGAKGFDEGAYLLTVDNILATNCIGTNLKITGEFKVGSVVEANDCTIYDVTNVHLYANNCFINSGTYTDTELKKCQIEGDIKIADYGTMSGINIVFNGDNTTIDLISGPGTISLDIDSGYFELLNSVEGCLAEFNLRGGEIEINENCIGGELYIEGYGKLYNNGTMDIKANNLLTKDIWDSMTTDYQIPGSTGKALTSAGASGDPWTGEIPGSYIEGQAGYILEQIRLLTEELHRIQGLDASAPMTITDSVRTAGDIVLNIEGNNETLSIVSRQ
jgi:hypothetical protein